MSDGGWSSDDDAGFGGGLTMEEIAAQSADSTAELLEKVHEKLYGEQPDEVEATVADANDNKGADESNGFAGGGYDPWGAASTEPATPCHVEWANMTHLRVRGVGIFQGRDVSAATVYREAVAASSLASLPTSNGAQLPPAAPTVGEGGGDDEVFAAHGVGWVADGGSGGSRTGEHNDNRNNEDLSEAGAAVALAAASSFSSLAEPPLDPAALAVHEAGLAASAAVWCAFMSDVKAEVASRSLSERR